MATYSKRFSGQRDTGQYRNAAFRGRQLNAGAPAISNVNPLFAPGRQAAMREQLRADTLLHRQMKIEDQRQAEDAVDRALNRDTQRQTNQINMGTYQRQNAEAEFDPNTPLGEASALQSRPPQTPTPQLRPQAPQRALNQEIIDAGTALNNPQATPEQRQAAKMRLAELQKVRLGERQPAIAEIPPMRLPNTDLRSAMTGGGVPRLGEPPQAMTPPTTTQQPQGFVEESLPTKPVFGRNATAKTIREGTRQYEAEVAAVHARNQAGKQAFDINAQNLRLGEQNISQSKSEETRRGAEFARKTKLDDAALAKQYTPESIKAWKADKGELVEKPEYTEAADYAEIVKNRSVYTPESWNQYEQSKAKGKGRDKSLLRVSVIDDKNLPAATYHFRGLAEMAGYDMGGAQMILMKYDKNSKVTGEELSPAGQAYGYAVKQIREQNPSLTDAQVAARAAAQSGIPSLADPDIGAQLDAQEKEARSGFNDKPALAEVARKRQAWKKVQAQVKQAAKGYSYTRAGASQAGGTAIESAVARAMAQNGLTSDEALKVLADMGLIEQRGRSKTALASKP